MVWNSFNGKDREKFSPERLRCTSLHVLSDKLLVVLWMRKSHQEQAVPRLDGSGQAWVACSPEPEHLQAWLGWASPSGSLGREQAAWEQRLGEMVQRWDGDIGFITHRLSTSKGFASVWPEMALWGFSRGSVRVCTSYGLPGAAGNGAGSWGAYNSGHLLHLLGTECSGGRSPSFWHLCRKQIPTIEELNTLNHYRANRSYPCPPCFRWCGKTKQTEKNPHPPIRIQRLPCWKQCRLQAGLAFSCVN